MMKTKRSTLVPLILAVYLAFMASIGYGEYAAGVWSPLYYFRRDSIVCNNHHITDFNLKRRERLRREREDDMNNQNKTL